MVIDIPLFWVALLLDPQGCYYIPVTIEGPPPPPQRPRDLYGLAGGCGAQRKGAPIYLRSRGSIGAEPPSRALVSGAPKVIASRGLSTPRSSRDYHLIINIDRDLDTYKLKLENKRI